MHSCLHLQFGASNVHLMSSSLLKQLSHVGTICSKHKNLLQLGHRYLVFLSLDLRQTMHLPCDAAFLGAVSLEFVLHFLFSFS
jgi:hypothetical protein